MQIECPFCGCRQVEEFHCRGMVPESNAAIAALYERENRMDRSDEYWQHDGGCRAWLLVRRNPSTGEVLDIRPLDSAVEGGVQ